jgi:methyl-accepting chemotaxis protein
MLGIVFGALAAQKTAALELLRANVMLADEKLNIVYMNKSLMRLMREAEAELKRELPDFSAAALVGSNIDVFHKNPRQQREMLLKLVQPHAATIRVGSRTFDLLVTPLVEAGKRTGFAVEWADARERLLNFDYAAQMTSIGRTRAIAVYSVEGTILAAHDRCLDATGYALDDMKGKNHRMLVHPSERESPEQQAFWNSLARGENQAGEFRRIGKSGKEIWLQANYNPILDQSGKVTKIVTFSTDVTGRVRAVNEIGAGLAMLAEADLSHFIDNSFDPTFEKLNRDFNDSLVKLGATLRKVLESVTAITSAGQDISLASDDLSQRTEQQAASIEETAAAMDEVTATVRKTAEGAKHARDIVADTRADATQSGEIVNSTIEAMSRIEKSSGEISQIIGVIDEIAFQTNLLALNAGVEAARAGDAGRGFAVVASEVRALAQRAADAARQIKALITTSSGEVGNGVKWVGQAGAALTRIASKVADIDRLVNDIALGAEEQATTLQEVNTAVNEMDRSTQQNAAIAEQATAAGHALAKETDNLSQLVAQFKLAPSNGDSSLRRELGKVAPHAFGAPSQAQKPPVRNAKLKLAGQTFRPGNRNG